MVLDIETIRNHYTFIENIRNKTKVIGVYENIQNISLQCNAHGTTRKKLLYMKKQLNRQHGANTD